ncbi:MAG: sensor histidine kinase [Verrucomicrobiales bacterium]|nr:sensor histidine kinase [Verrucomicrobiales bacterium]
MARKLRVEYPGAVYHVLNRGEQPAGHVPGIGLAVARECVELHGGEISAANLPEGGSCLRVRLKTSAPASEVLEAE